MSRPITDQRRTDPRKGLALVKDSVILDDLVNSAMSVTNGDWDWENENLPEVKHTRDGLRKSFSAILRRHHLLSSES